MNKYLAIIFLIFTLSLAQAQEDQHQCFIVLKTQDTIFGQIEDKDYSSRSSVKIIVDNYELKYFRRHVQSIHFANKEYIKSRYDIVGHKFFLKTEVGTLNIYKRKRKVFIGAYDSDINFGGIQAALKFYCDDWPGLVQYFPLNNDSVYKNSSLLPSILTEYHQWKADKPESKSSYEMESDKRSSLNFKISFIAPGVGLEIGLGEKFSLESIVQAHYNIFSKKNPIVPAWNNQLRFFMDSKTRKLKNRRLYKYNGIYLALKDEYYFTKDEHVAGLLLGLQNVIGKYWYMDLAVGAGYNVYYENYTIMVNLGLGYVF